MGGLGAARRGAETLSDGWKAGHGLAGRGWKARRKEKKPSMEWTGKFRAETPRKRLREVDFVVEGRGYRGGKRSEDGIAVAKLAREGQR